MHGEGGILATAVRLGHAKSRRKAKYMAVYLSGDVCHLYPNRARKPSLSCNMNFAF